MSNAFSLIRNRKIKRYILIVIFIYILLNIIIFMSSDCDRIDKDDHGKQRVFYKYFNLKHFLCILTKRKHQYTQKDTLLTLNDILITIKTTNKNFFTRLKDIHDTWYQFAKFKVY